jgi:hypothetical protein
MGVRRILILLLLVLMSGCASLDSMTDSIMNPQKEFEGSNRDFMQRLRWNDLHGAAGYVTEPNRQKFIELYRGKDDLNITDVRMESAEFTASGEQVDTWLIIEYYRLPSVTLKTFGYAQRWTYFGKDEVTPVGWKITSIAPPLP